MNTNFTINHHEKPLPTRIKLDKTRLVPQPATKTPLPPHQIQHRKALVTVHRQRELPRGMNREIVDGLLVRTKGLEEDERVGVEDGDGAVGGGGDEVAREGEGGGGVEGEGGDGGGVVVVEEGAEGGGGREVVEVDGVVGAAGSGGGAGASDGGDGGEVGRVGEERGEGEGVGVGVVLCGFELETPYESLVGACDDAHCFLSLLLLQVLFD